MTTSHVHAGIRNVPKAKTRNAGPRGVNGANAVTHVMVHVKDHETVHVEALDALTVPVIMSNQNNAIKTSVVLGTGSHGVNAVSPVEPDKDKGSETVSVEMEPHQKTVAAVVMNS